MGSVKIIECPRDAMQGVRNFIPTQDKLTYIKSLLPVGFHTIDIGSFVSAKSIPQMADTKEILRAVETLPTQSKFLVIVANLRGALEASEFEIVDYLGFPFSISENFQMRNTHKSIQESIEVLIQILELADRTGKEVVVYLSMGFGNPYGDFWNVEIVEKWVDMLSKMGVKIISLSDTIGVAKSDDISQLYQRLIPSYSHIEFGAHFHTLPNQWYEKVQAAYDSGCLRFDGAIRGFGGCPMALDELTGNMPTERLFSFFSSQKIDHNLNTFYFERAYNAALELFKSS